MDLKEVVLTKISIRPDELLLVRVPLSLMGGLEGKKRIRDEIAALLPGRQVAVIAKEIDFVAVREEAVKPPPPPPVGIDRR